MSDPPTFLSGVAISLGESTILGESTKIIWIDAPFEMKPERIVCVESECVQSGSKRSALFVSEIKIDGQRQLPDDCNPISVQAFHPSIINNNLACDPIKKGSRIEFEIRNFSAQSRELFIALYGSDPA